jgi:hypothetical protein
MPLEIGKAVKIKKLSPEEERKLLELGWRHGQPIPENLTDLMEAVKGIQSDATDVENMPPPIPLDTPAMKYDASKEVDIEDLPADQQIKYRKMMEKIFQDAAAQETRAGEIAAAIPEGAGEGVAETIRKALMPGTEIEIEDDSDELTAEAGAKPAVEADGKKCARCGFLADMEDPVIITDEDRDSFVQSADSLQLFTKTFEFYGGAVRITVREQTRAEQDMLYDQIVLDIREKRVTSDDVLQAQRRRYNIPVQILRIEARKTEIKRPSTIKEWEEKVKTFEDPSLLPEDTLLRKISLFNNQEELPDSIFRLQLSVIGEFEIIQRKLEDQSREPDFWKPRTDAS